MNKHLTTRAAARERSFEQVVKEAVVAQLHGSGAIFYRGHTSSDTMSPEGADCADIEAQVLAYMSRTDAKFGKSENSTFTE